MTDLRKANLYIYRNFDIFKKSDIALPLKHIIDKASRRECLLCYTNLDKDIGEGVWHVPLCKEHRAKILTKYFKKRRDK